MTTTPITTASFSAQLTLLLAQFAAGQISMDQMIADLTALCNNWTMGSTTETQLGIQLSQALGNWNNFVSGQLTWMTTTPTGGPHGNGTVDLVDYLGNITTISGLQLLMSVIAKGDPAKNDVVFGFQGSFRTNELRHVFTVPDNMNFQATASAYFNTGPQGACSIRFTKNGTFANPASPTNAEIVAALWATATFAPPGVAGQPVTGTVTFAGAATLAKNDVVRTIGPLVQDPYLADGSISFGGA